MPSLFDPSGFVPYPCDHGTPVKPKRYPPTKGKLARLDLSGDELPPFGGRSWGRSKYLLHMDPVVIEGKHIQFKPKCVVCLGQPKPDDFYTPADR
jgi:hypothetical protein